MSHANRLDNASSTFFFLGFAVSQLRFIPIPLITALSNSLSLLFYFIAYGLWLAASHLYPSHPGLNKHWYGFAQFKNQHSLSAFIGAIAILFSFATFFFPVAALPACWLFLISNSIWLISEYHKKKNPIPSELNFSSARQEVYIEYALVVTVSSLITALATTIIVFVPVAALPTLLIASILGASLGATTFRLWLDYNFNEYPADQPKNSYEKMLNTNLVNDPQNDYEMGIEMQTFPSLFSSAKLKSRNDSDYNNEAEDDADLNHRP